MGIIGKVKALFTGTDAPQPGSTAAGLLQGLFLSGEPPRRNTVALLQAYRKIPWLRAIVHRIAADVSGVPVLLYAPARGTKGDKARGLARSLVGTQGPTRRALVDGALKDGSLVPVLSHPFLDLVSRMNPALKRKNTMLITQAWLDIKGEAFWLRERAANGNVIELWPVPPHACIRTPAANDPTFHFQWGSWRKQVIETDVLWLRDPDPENPYGRGSGNAEALSDELDIDEFAAEHIRTFFFNRGMPHVFVTAEGISSKTEAERFERKLNEQYGGRGKGHKIHVGNGKIEVQEVGQTFKDMQMIELRSDQKLMMLQSFNMPPEIMGIVENSNRATIESAYYLYALGVLEPRLDSRDDALQEIADEWSEGLIVAHPSTVPDDKEFKLSVMQAQATVFSKNEWRTLAGAVPRDGWDDEFPSAPAPMLPEPGGAGPAAPEPVDDPADKEEDDDEEEKAPAPKVRSLPPVSNLLEALVPDRLTKLLDPIWEARTREWGDAALKKLSVDTKFDMQNPLVKDLLQDFSTNKIKGLVNGATKDALKATLEEGYRAGEGAKEIAARVKDVFAVASSSRALTIARTEVVGTANRANVIAFEMSGVVQSKEWLSVQDGATRDTHKDMDGQRVTLAAKFESPTGGKASAPGQFGIAEEDINCRCTVLPVVDGKTVDDREAEWKAFDKAALITSWESDAVGALQAGFGAQEADLLKLL